MSDVPAIAQVGMRVHYVIGGVVSGIVLLLCLGLILLFCCCRKKKAVKKEYDNGRSANNPPPKQTQVPPPYYTNGMDNKGMERTMDVIEDAMKSFNGQNGYISYNGLHPNGNGSKWIDEGHNLYYYLPYIISFCFWQDKWVGIWGFHWGWLVCFGRWAGYSLYFFFCG